MSTSEAWLEQLQSYQDEYASVDYSFSLPKDEPIYVIDQVSRTITGPFDQESRTLIKSSMLGVVEDHQSDRIIFEIDRECNGIDLAQMSCIVIFKNANNKIFSYVVPKYNIISGQVPEDNEDPSKRAKMYFVWTLQAPVMEKAGTVQYMVKFFKIGPDGKIKFEFNTRVASGIVQDTWTHTLTGHADNSNYYNILIDDQVKELFQNWQEAIDNHYFDVYWTDL